MSRVPPHLIFNISVSLVKLSLKIYQYVTETVGNIAVAQGSPNFSALGPHMTALYRPRTRKLKYSDNIHLNKIIVSTANRLLKISYQTCG
jgi:hypothetical protein